MKTATESPRFPNSERICRNCQVHVADRAGHGDRGPDSAWFPQCVDCARAVADQLELILDRPDDQPIQILRCRWCGLERACRPEWATRCHICHDQRTAQVCLDDLTVLYNALANAENESATALEAELRSFALLDDDSPIEAVHQADFIAALAAFEELEDRGQTGWTLLAADLSGWPWEVSGSRKHSHGTWARHDRCGRTQKLMPGRGRTECRHCPPEPESRTFRARATGRHLLYLVQFDGLQKFGHGTLARVHDHLRQGTPPVQVIESTHQETVLAEAALKRRYRDVVLLGSRSMPSTFGAGTEVLPYTIHLDLTDVLTGRDMKHRFG